MNVQFTNLLSRVQSSKVAVPAIVGVAAFASGTALGYILGKRNGDVFEVYVDEDVVQGDYMDSVDDEYIPLWSRANITNLALFEEAEETWLEEHFLDEEAEMMIEEDEELEAALDESEEAFEPEVNNIFAGNDEDWDYEAELSTRTATNPYVIHIDEFVEDSMDFHQKTVTYYAGDDIMADETDTPLYGYYNLMGELKFGHGSKDPNVVYIRSEAFQTEWEVLLHQGSYAIEVEGMHIEQQYETKELKHSVPRFRPE